MSSSPPTPRSSTMRFNLTLPPVNYGAVQDGQVFRSAFPRADNISFLRELKIKTVLCLVDTELSQECSTFIDETDAQRIRLDIAPNKNGEIKTSLHSIYDALLVILDVANYPLHIHCNQGRHRTGCVVACLRRLQGWPMKEILEEYEAYAFPKVREGDIKLIRDVFDPEDMLEYVKHVNFEHRPGLMQLLRSDLVDVDTLVQILGSSDGIAHTQESLKSSESTRADSGIELCSTQVDARESKVQISITECLPHAGIDADMVDV